MPKGVLLANLGTPQSPTTADVRAYLREFLGDPKVVRAPRWIWYLVLNGIILPFRAPRSARLYRSIWLEAGSPLAVHSREQAQGLAKELGPEFRVALAMRYGQPSVRAALEELRSQGCQQILLLPLFPQQSDTTTGTLVEHVERELRARADEAMQWKVVEQYADHPLYIQALAESIRATSGQERAQHLVLSFHGLPQSYVDQGDPYFAHCQRTTLALQAALGRSAEQVSMTFQSRFGPQRWLEPATLRTVCALAKRYPVLHIATPGFPADCLETLEEIRIGLREAFHEAGGHELIVTPCLNASPTFARALADLSRVAFQQEFGSGGRT